MHGGKPWMTEFDNRFVQAAGRAIEKGFGKAPVFNREGGSIPVVATFQEILGLPSVLFGVGLPDENAHAPNEKLDLGNFHGGDHRVGVPVRGGRRRQWLHARAGGAGSARRDGLLLGFQQWRSPVSWRAAAPILTAIVSSRPPRPPTTRAPAA